MQPTALWSPQKSCWSANIALSHIVIPFLRSHFRGACIWLRRARAHFAELGHTYILCRGTGGQRAGRALPTLLLPSGPPPPLSLSLSLSLSPVGPLCTGTAHRAVPVLNGCWSRQPTAIAVSLSLLPYSSPFALQKFGDTHNFSRTRGLVGVKFQRDFLVWLRPSTPFGSERATVSCVPRASREAAIADTPATPRSRTLRCARGTSRRGRQAEFKVTRLRRKFLKTGRLWHRPTAQRPGILCNL